MLFRSAFSAVLRVSMMPPVCVNVVMLAFNCSAMPLVELKSDATVAGLLVSAVFSALLSTTIVPSAGSSFSVMPIAASVVPVLPEPTEPADDVGQRVLDRLQRRVAQQRRLATSSRS